ncbi:phosphoenolpyruvate--protein phosphotransferase [Nocardia donostiensis]|uniref:Phosphocarrier protein HPr n=1 Tax=Nocardia donostiensis TaxID=1538463 RepID=A0A1V2TJY7_9NOCA|nr:phosphoenolpyruvate--protein phosphotransferase [Nocardia donostiensis]ONM49835.1 phosphoenolpyruvate--protein phosphotransferase [Nocardia donostiensis]OQS22213.1 phosphoenolpyruvate--protein phosphotransferase [Nocardia donostiensis]
MIGIVVVSHSRPLAHAAVDLATQMLHGERVRIEIAAGLAEEPSGDDKALLGTDALAVADAIAAADTGEGVLVLMDLGSAILSAELALDLMPTAPEVKLCAAPLVEGLVAASVAAAGGATLTEAANEAENALLGKRAQLGLDAGTEPSAPADQHAADSARASFTVDNEHGLHARPASRIVAALRGLDCEVRLRNLANGAGPAAGRSLSRIAALGALTGHTIEATATGPDAEVALNRLVELAQRRFDEKIADAPTSSPRDTSTEPGLTERSAAGTTTASTAPLPASPGIGIGPAWQLELTEIALPDQPSGPPGAERHLLNGALARTKNRLRAHIGAAEDARLHQQPSPEPEVFQAHLLLLEDEELVADAHRRIDNGASAATAWASSLDTAADELEALSDPYLRARAADLRAVRDQVLAVLLGHDTEVVSRPGILLATDLTPAQASGLDPSIVTGIVLAHGSPTSHAAIITRAKGIPSVHAAGEEILRVPAGVIIALDGGTGELAVDPETDVLAKFKTRASEQRRQRLLAESTAGQVATMRDGLTVHVAANIGHVAEAAHAVRAGADLAGLVRTEFLFLGREHAPSVDEQEQVYREIAQSFEGRRIVLRTLDVGGDKPLPYLSQPQEHNPFLGLRGIRFALAFPQLLRDQLQAIVRVAADHPVSVMFPMVTVVDEVRAARALLADIAPPGIDIEVGIMVEVPAVATKAAVFAQLVDFFSIGTNDLAQYTLATERGNESVADLADPLDPGVLHLIDHVCRGAGDTRVAVCGEVAADPTAIPLLLGLGVTELSVTPPAVPLVKAAVRELDLRECRAAAARALSCESAAAVRG